MSRTKENKTVIVDLDIGTSKVVAIVGEISADDRLEVIGLGSNPSRGLKRGVVVIAAESEGKVSLLVAVTASMRPSRHAASSGAASACGSARR